MDRPQISLIIPTINEAENLPALAARIDSALSGRRYEILVVDDNSKDDTVDVCVALARKYPFRLITRTVPKDGLGGAVLCGLKQCAGEYLVVMDADLQHPPERLTALLEPLEKQEADFVLGSRNVEGGSTFARWSLFRQINSAIATWLARPFTGKITDPMSGFFAMHRKTYERAERLTPLGYKIGLELMCKCRVKRVREIPIHFAQREHGHSKLSVREQFRYLEHLSRLYDFCFPRLSPVAKFTFVVGLSWLVGAAICKSLLLGQIYLPVAVTIAYAGVVLTEAIFHRRYIRTQRDFLLSKHPWIEFAVVAGIEWSVCVAVAFWTHHRVSSPRAAEVLVLSFGAATVARYVLRKELMQDIRGLRREIRRDELMHPGEHQ